VPVVPAPATPPPVAPIPAPAPPPVAIAPPVVALRSAARGTCPECKAGESALSVDGIAAAGAPGACTTALQTGARTAMAASARALPAGLPPGAPTAIDPALAGVASDGGSACRLLAVTLPAGAKYLGYRYDASDSGASADCMQGKECPIGRAAFAEHAAVEHGPNGSVVWVLFENRDQQRARRAELVVYYRAAGATP
jgi:hypothetical protein